MSVAVEILERFGEKLYQLHVSEVNTNSQDDALSFETILAFQRVSSMIQQTIPAILESIVTPGRIDEESQCAERRWRFQQPPEKTRDLALVWRRALAKAFATLTNNSELCIS